ncbi:hypothetical protein AQUSIP_23920 [Aquicella siphonis]|uniref:Pilus assembly protein PilO n=1 Tax=Aquicella siphonis TaxID=254247 RepID=A0A5E4PKJ2_9COXI|nr:type 4a pilus biogenesis protein PilO [Aquicella siphonis]VVC77065.1 hypothetical protein AQUSIP_23920 [Aquicella siphonis]
MQNLDIKKIYEWPLGMRALVYGLIFVFVFYLGYQLDISPYQLQIKNSVLQEDDLKRQLQLMHENQRKVTRDVEQLPKAKALLSEWQKNIITKNELPDLLDDILKAGTASQLKITTFDPAAEIKDGIYYKTPVSINLSGTYDQIATFISQLANMPKMVNIDAFILNNDAQNDPAASVDSRPLNSNDILSAVLDIDIYRK